MKRVNYLFIIIPLLLSCQHRESSQKKVIESHPNGNKKIEVEIIENRECLTFYFENQNVDRTYCKMNGAIEGEVLFYYESGEVYQKVYYEAGEKNGPLIGYRQNGEVWEETIYLDGLKHGKSYIYEEDGNLEWEIIYWKGKEVYAKNYDQKAGKTKMRIYPVFELNKDTFNFGDSLKARVWLPVYDSIGSYSIKVGVVPMEEFGDIHQNGLSTTYPLGGDTVSYSTSLIQSGSLAFYCLLYYLDDLQAGFCGEGSQEITVFGRDEELNERGE